MLDNHDRVLARQRQQELGRALDFVRRQRRESLLMAWNAKEVARAAGPAIVSALISPPNKETGALRRT